MQVDNGTKRRWRRQLPLKASASLAALMLTVPLGCSQQKQGYLQTTHQPKQLTVNAADFCELIAHQAQFKGVRTSIKVQVQTWKHGISITSPACPKRSLAMFIESDHAATVNPLDRALEQSRKDWKPFRAEIIGTIESAPPPPTFVQYGPYIFRASNMILEEK